MMSQTKDLSARTALLSDQYPICRICLEEDISELIRPCLCLGTQALVHINCVTEWLKFSDKHGCEICGTIFGFEQRKLRPISNWQMPQPLNEDFEDQVDFTCCVFWILFNLRIVHSLYYEGVSEIHSKLVQSFNSQKIAFLWWISLVFNMVYYSTRVVALYEKWIIDNSDYVWVFDTYKDERSSRRQT